MKKILLLLLIAISFSSCEKDDICSDETTPRLILEFYDISNPATLKNVTSLKIKAIDVTKDLGTYSAVSKIALPLNPGSTTTKYSMILNSNSTVNSNEDFLEFNYATQQAYVSRACGYKTTYTLNNTDGLVLTDADTPDLFWIKSTNILTTTITTENETHIKIYL